MTPYFERGGIAIYHGDCREIIPSLSIQADCVIADPPYAQTSLAWDTWPDGWLRVAFNACVPTGSLWCFGSLKMFMLRAAEFFSWWSLAQDIVWEKHDGSSFAADRFKRVHEQAVHFYRGDAKWDAVYKKPVLVRGARARSVRNRTSPPHTGAIGSTVNYRTENGGPKLMRSVIVAASCHGFAENETQKPVEIVAPLIEYACPPGGLILSPFCGSGTDLVIAKDTGRRAIGIDIREEQCEIAARRVSERLPFAEREA